MRNIDIGHDTNVWAITSDTSVTAPTITFGGVVVLTLYSNGTVGAPGYTTTERNALTALVAGQFIYNETTNKLNVYTGAGWEAVTSA